MVESELTSGERFNILGEAMKIFVNIVLTLCLMLFCLGTAGAIEKSKKDQPAPKKDSQVVRQKSPEKAQNPVDTKAAQTPAPERKNYDDFIDRNNNGIDDRAEKGATAKKPSAPETRSKTTKKAPRP